MRVFLRLCFNEIAGVSLANTEHSPVSTYSGAQHGVEASPAEVDGSTYS